MFDRLDDVHRVTGINVIHDLVLVTVNDGDLAGITLDNHEEVLPVTTVQRFGGIVLGFDIDFVTLFHQRERHFRRNRGFHLNVGGQHLDLFLAEDIVEVVHTTFGTQRDNTLQTLLTFLFGLYRLQALACGALTQHTMTTGAALEVHAFRCLEIGLVQGNQRLILLGKSHSRGSYQTHARGEHRCPVLQLVFHTHLLHSSKDNH